MSNNQDHKTSKSHTNGETDRLENTLQELAPSTDYVKLTQDDDEQKASDTAVQEVFSKFQKIHKYEDDEQMFIRQSVLLCDELIGIVDHLTDGDVSEFKKCFELLYKKFPDFDSSTHENIDKLFIRKVFFQSLDLLSKPQICSYLNNIKHTTERYKNIYQYLTNFLLHLASSVIQFVPFKKDDTLTNKYNELFRSMLKWVRFSLHHYHQGKQWTEDDQQTTETILSFFWNLSDRIIMIQWLFNIDFVAEILDCLKIIDFSSGLLVHCISMIHNVARHDSGADELQRLDGLATLKEVQSKYTDELDADDYLVISMAIALLSTSEQIRSDNKRMNEILNQLLQIVIDAATVSMKHV